jgi:ribose transport system substrate-binding protein
MAGLREAMPEATETCRIVSLDGDGQFKVSLERVRKHLRESKATHVLVAAANDPSALGTARAFQESGRAATCAIVGQNAEPDARAELRESSTPLIASVGYFPEKYGDGIIRLAVDILARRAVPPAVFVRHQLVTRENVEHLYPNDRLYGIRSLAT